MHQHLVLRVITKIFTPFVLMFGLYVQLHGEYSPGGGFQAGILLAVVVILHAMLFGLDYSQKLVSPGLVRICCACGILIYGGTGIASMLLGGHFLDYDMLASEPVAGQKLGIMIIEMGVGLTVCSAMVLIYYAFAGAERSGPPPELDIRGEEG